MTEEFRERLAAVDDIQDDRAAMKYMLDRQLEFMEKHLPEQVKRALHMELSNTTLGGKITNRWLAWAWDFGKVVVPATFILYGAFVSLQSQVDGNTRSIQDNNVAILNSLRNLSSVTERLSDNVARMDERMKAAEYRINRTEDKLDDRRSHR